MRRLLLLALLALGAAALAPLAVATAAPTDPFQYKFSVDGSALPNGLSNVGSIAVNHATGNVLVLDRNQGAVDQFDAAGNPVSFSALGSPTIPTGGGEVVMVDNSGGPAQGNIYVFAVNGAGSEFFWAYGPNGESLAANPQPLFVEVFEGFTGSVLIEPDGTLRAFYSNFSGTPHVAVLTPDGKAGADVEFNGTVPLGPGIADGLGHVYLPGSQAFDRFDSDSSFTNEGSTGLPLGDILGVDPSTNDLFARTGGKIRGVHYSDPLVASTPFDLLGADVYGAGGGFDFDQTGEYLYVGEGDSIGVYHREPPTAPSGLQVDVGGIRSSRAVLTGDLVENGAATSYLFEYGTDTSYGNSTPEAQVPFAFKPVRSAAIPIEGLAPNTTYHVRMVATNSAGTFEGPDRTFTTYATPPGGPDPCPNALARKATGARTLPDCRAFELVSAADTGGYDVESSLAPGQTPFPGFPLATGRVLYATHSGAVPGPWKATNRGPDPYLATRGPEGWRTRYVGLPSDINTATPSFSSVLGEADTWLGAFAFAGPELCSPCFTGGGLETGIPVRLPNGNLTQGMAGSLDPGVASARPEGKVAKFFSDDGEHLVFASKYAFEPGANNNGSDLTVYKRDLTAGTTQIVSTDPGGATLTGAGISELDIASNGSRVVVGKSVATDAAGNEYVHPYMHLGSSPNSVDLAPGTTSGVLFAGMTDDGGRAFFTTPDSLVSGEDTDTSADLYEAAVDSGGNLELNVVAAPDSNACNPVSNSARAHWNTPGAGANCDVVAIAGGGGLASGSGTMYFLSPEQLDGTAGTPNQPNLYQVAPGQNPRFVATLEADNPLVLHSVGAAETRETSDFETTADGAYAVFRSALELTGVHTFGFLEVFQFDAGANRVSCASCDTTNTSETALAANAELAPAGLSLIDDGRVFFTTKAALVLNDANGRRDVYSWSGGLPQLISSGVGTFDSALLTVSADGTDAFFFTRDALAPEEDRNGALARIYDAREGGGFFRLPPDVPCAASDECHGPGTVAPPPPDIKSSGRTTHGNFVTCKKNQVKRGGKCVKKAKKHKKKNGKGQQGKGKRHA